MTLDSIQSQLTEAQGQVDRLQKVKAFLEALSRETLDQLPNNGYVCGDTLDFDRLSHDDIIAVIKLLPARWNKTPIGDEARINYAATINGVKIRCYSGEPPPNCRVEEYTVEVAAQPARTVKKKRLVCTEVIDSKVNVATPVVDEIPF